MARKEIGPGMVDRLVDVKWLSKRLGIGLSTVWAKVKSGILPQPIRLGGRTTRWRQSEIEAMIAGEKPQEA